MGLFRNISNGFRNLFRRRRISINNASTNHEEWHTHLSPASILTAFVALVAIIFAVILTLVGYSSILETLPGYKTLADRSREVMISNITKIDSMERVLVQIAEYNDNIALIMDGKTPVTRSQVGADTTLTITDVIKNGADSMLRAQMEGKGAYSLETTQADSPTITRAAINFTAPIEGLITDRFDLKNDNFGVKIASTSKSAIYAADKGIVALSLWTPESGYVVQILHSNNMISIYKNLSRSLVEQGQVVKRGEVIGYSSEITKDGSESILFAFELWIEGKPVNPERYIIF